LRNYVVQAEIDAGERQGLSSEERRELAELRRQNRRLAMVNEILERAAALDGSWRHYGGRDGRTDGCASLGVVGSEVAGRVHQMGGPSA
jgi:hypothetical protein